MLSAEVQDFLEAIGIEYERARYKFPQFHSLHEGYAVLWEEVEEIWEIAKGHAPIDLEALRDECIQVAAMALAISVEIGENKLGISYREQTM